MLIAVADSCCLVPTGSDYESSDSDSNDGGNTPTISSITTPLTPLSPQASHKHPSDLLKIHRCSYYDCDKSFNRPAKLVQHLRSHTNTRPFVCPHPPCSKDFLRESHLKHHIKSAHSDVRDHVCQSEGCNKSFITATRLRRHQAVHEGHEKYKCTVTTCGQSFRKHGTLQRHVASVHEGKKPIVCLSLKDDGTECGSGFETPWDLKSHTTRAHDTKRHICTICSASGGDDSTSEAEVAFSTYAALQEHVAVDHPPICPECGLKCKTQRDMKNHIEVWHDTSINERKIHACTEPDCGKTYTTKGNLSKHVQTSHGDKKFLCQDIDLSILNNVGDWDGHNACGRSTKTKASLEEHIRIAHLGLKGKPRTKINSSPKENATRKTQGSAITRLTGAGYNEDTRRPIACLVPGCEFRFVRDYDLDIHLQARHGLADLEIQGMKMEQEELYERTTFQGPPILANSADLEADIALYVLPAVDVEGNDFGGSFEAEAARGGNFWLGGDLCQFEAKGDEWMYDKMDMHRLINGKYGVEDFREESGNLRL